MSSRDPFAHLDRMRREMDELFGDALGRSGLSRRRAGRWPAVDVAYASSPPRAIVTVEIAGVRASQIELHVEGRRLIIAGQRGAPSPEGEVYQQIEIERGAFRRIVELGADVDSEQVRARYEDGILRVELPLLSRSAGARPVPIEHGGEGDAR
jgi:HSP20 family protein